MAKNVRVSLQFLDEYSRPLKEAQEKIKKSTAAIREQAARVAELRSQIKSYEEIKKLSTKQDIADANLKNKQIRDQIRLVNAETDEIKQQLRVEKQQESQIRKIHNDRLKRHQKQIDALKNVAKYAKAAALAAAGAAVVEGVKTGITAAAELETLRANIETVTKSSERASEVMQHAVHLANRSAFDNAELIEAASALETYGLNTQNYLTAIGDAAAITGRDVADMARAFGKAAVSGQFDSLADIGITRDTLDKFAKSKGISLFDGTKIKDTKQFADTLRMFMDSRYAGGMERQADTLTGMWSTIKGIGRSGLGLIAGVKANGEIVDGSVFATLKEKLDGVRDALTQMEEEGGFDTLREQIEGIANVSLDAFFEVTGRIGENLKSWSDTLAKIKEWIEWAEGTKVGKLNSWIEQKKENAKGALPQWMQTIGGELKDSMMYGALAPLIGEARDVQKDVWGIAAYASGTSYHPGGAALVGERGPELVNLPRGSSVNTASQTRSILRGGNTVNIYIDGARRSDDELANTVAAKLLEALENV